MRQEIEIAKLYLRLHTIKHALFSSHAPPPH
jgi:hypothetical protein